ncbi:MAG: type II toxin-antitoxin system Phd/YefM family antitoxin [Vicinamibacteria bacterium]
MKKATIRQVQHRLSEVMKWVEDGEEVIVLRRDRVVAKIVPPDHTSDKPEWPDFGGRARRIWGKRVRGKPLSRIITENREERL